MSLQLREVMQRHVGPAPPTGKYPETPETPGMTRSASGARDNAISSRTPSLHFASQTRLALDKDDNASTNTTTLVCSSTCMQSIASSFAFLCEVRKSRPYRRIKAIRSGRNASTLSSFSLNSVPTRGGSWTILEAISLGDMSISELSVLELPIDCSDVWDSGLYERVVTAMPQGWASRKFTVKLRPSRAHLWKAIDTGNLYRLRLLAAVGADLEELDVLGRTPLAHAISTGNPRLVRVLLESGAKVGLMGYGKMPGNPDSRDDLEKLHAPTLDLRPPVYHENLTQAANGISALALAIAVGNEEVFQILLDAGADVDEIDSTGRTPLAYAACEYRDRKQTFQRLLSFGASIERIKNTISPVAVTPKLLRIIETDGDRVETALLLLVAFGDDITKLNRWVSLQILRALHNENPALVRKLLEHPCLRIDDQLSLGTRSSALKSATLVFEARHLLWKYLANKGIGAATLRHPGFQLLDERPTPNFYSEVKNNTVVEHYYVTLLQYLLYMLVRENDVHLDWGIKLAHHNDDWEGASDDDWVFNDASKVSSLLHTIAASAKIDMQEADICSVLLSRAPALYMKPLARRNMYFSVVITAEENQTATTEVTSFLVKHRLHQMVHDDSEGGLRLLLAIGADIEAAACSPNIYYGDNYYRESLALTTPLLQALLENRQNMVKFLLRQGANPCVRVVGRSLRTALHIACQASDSYKLVTMLLATRARTLINSQDQWGYTPLHTLVLSGINFEEHERPEAARALVEAGADLYQKDQAGRTPYRLACYMQLPNHMRYIRRPEISSHAAKAICMYRVQSMIWSLLSPEQRAGEQPPPADWTLRTG